MKQPFFSQGQQKIRKRWLVAALAQFGITPLVNFTHMILSGSLSSIEPHLAIVGSCLVILFALSFFLLFYLSYHRLGTRVLSFAIVMGITSLCLSLFYGWNMDRLFSANVFFILASLLVSVWWLVESVRLRKMNLEIRSSRSV